MITLSSDGISEKLKLESRGFRNMTKVEEGTVMVESDSESRKVNEGFRATERAQLEADGMDYHIVVQSSMSL